MFGIEQCTRTQGAKELFAGKKGMAGARVKSQSGCELLIVSSCRLIPFWQGLQIQGALCITSERGREGQLEAEAGWSNGYGRPCIALTPGVTQHKSLWGCPNPIPSTLGSTPPSCMCQNGNAAAKSLWGHSLWLLLNTAEIGPHLHSSGLGTWA